MGDSAALREALPRLRRTLVGLSEPGSRGRREYGPEVLVVSLGVDTHRDDPSGSFTLDSGHYVDVGRRLAALGLPTLFVLEGGYALEVLGANVANVVAGFEEAAR